MIAGGSELCVTNSGSIMAQQTQQQTQPQHQQQQQSQGQQAQQQNQLVVTSVPQQQTPQQPQPQDPSQVQQQAQQGPPQQPTDQSTQQQVMEQVQQQVASSQHQPQQQMVLVNTAGSQQQQQQIQVGMSTPQTSMCSVNNTISTMQAQGSITQPVQTNAVTPQLQQVTDWNGRQVQVLAQQPVQNTAYVQYANANGQMLMSGNIQLHPTAQNINPGSIQVITAGKPFQSNQIASHVIGKPVLAANQQTSFPSYTTIPTTNNQTLLIGQLGVISSQPNILPAHSAATAQQKQDMQKIKQAPNQATSVQSSMALSGCVVSQPATMLHHLISPIQYTTCQNRGIQSNNGVQLSPWHFGTQIPTQVWATAPHQPQVITAQNPIFIRGPHQDQPMFIQSQPQQQSMQQQQQQQAQSVGMAKPAEIKAQPGPQVSRTLSILPSMSSSPIRAANSSTVVSTAQIQVQKLTSKTVRTKSIVTKGTTIQKLDAQNQTKPISPQPNLQHPPGTKMIITSQGTIMPQQQVVAAAQPAQIQALQQVMQQQQHIPQHQLVASPQMQTVQSKPPPFITMAPTTLQVQAPKDIVMASPSQDPNLVTGQESAQMMDTSNGELQMTQMQVAPVHQPMPVPQQATLMAQQPQPPTLMTPSQPQPSLSMPVQQFAGVPNQLPQAQTSDQQVNIVGALAPPVPSPAVAPTSIASASPLQPHFTPSIQQQSQLQALQLQPQQSNSLLPQASQPVQPHPVPQPLPQAQPAQQAPAQPTQNSDSNSKSGPPKAFVKPQVLTHVIEGYVIQESSEPFPINRTSLLSELAQTVKARKEKRDTDNAIGADEPPAKKQNIEPVKGAGTTRSDSPSIVDDKKAKCQGCGLIDFKDKFKKGKKFCSLACAKKAGAHTTGKRKGSADDKLDSSKNWDQSMESVGESMPTSAPGFLPATPRTDTPSTPVMPVIEDELKEFIGSNPVKWSVNEVREFIRKLPGCGDYAEDFAMHEIDGQALLLLKEDHLVSAMAMKLGPALKICAKIEDLRLAAEAVAAGSGVGGVGATGSTTPASGSVPASTPAGDKTLLPVENKPLEKSVS